MWRGHELFVSSLPLLVEYIPATLFYFLTPTVISLVLGALICRVRVGKKNPLYWLVSLFVSFFRGTPGLVQIYIVFFGLPKLFEPFGININRWDAGIFYVIATCCNFSSFVSEAFRGAYEAIDKDQIEAGYSIGYSRWQCFCHIIEPEKSGDRPPERNRHRLRHRRCGCHGPGGQDHCPAQRLRSDLDSSGGSDYLFPDQCGHRAGLQQSDPSLQPA